MPSHLGYRIYVDQLMHCQPLSEEEQREIDALFNVRDPDPDRLLEDAAEALADYTKCATVSTTITPKTVQVKRVEIVPAGARTVVVLVIATNGVIKNKVCRVDFGLTTEIVEFLNQFCNGRLVGKSVSDISQWYINSIAVTLGDYSTLFVPVLATVYELCREINEGQFYTSGSVNLLGYKEFSDIARDLLLTMNNREQLLGVLASKKRRGLYHDRQGEPPERAGGHLGGRHALQDRRAEFGRDRRDRAGAHGLREDHPAHRVFLQNAGKAPCGDV